jgi:hypothetical protein
MTKEANNMKADNSRPVECCFESLIVETMCSTDSQATYSPGISFKSCKLSDLFFCAEKTGDLIHGVRKLECGEHG